jgi:hypothetical protein
LVRPALTLANATFEAVTSFAAASSLMGRSITV